MRTNHSEIVALLVGMSPWNVALGVGSFLTMEFGEPEIHSYGRRKVVHGEWHLWLQDCEWRIEAAGGIFATSDEEHDKLSKKIHRLEFGSLTKAQVNEHLDLDLVCSPDIRLRASTPDSSENHQWD
ncbi:MAG TPA: hypothetical protein VI431_08655 [Candidatus Acidoferrum sp.]